ncbi:MAG TPA: hypothetical protein VF530_10755 [Planctomycetota bacterium]
MMSRSWSWLLLLGGLALAPLHAEQTRRSSFPRLEVSPGAETELVPGSLVGLELRVSDPDGETVSLRMPAPPPGLDFPLLVDEQPPFRVRLEWAVPASGLPARTVLAFEAEDASGRVTRLQVPFRILGSFARVVTGDVTGDGRDDVVAVARDADLPPHVNAGALYVWAGRRVPGGAPSAVLTAATPRSGDRLGTDGVQLGDVTGDGVLDVVADTRAANSQGVRDCGAIHVWAGGATLAGARTESALLVAPAPTELLQLHGSSLVDVTGDGVLDVVASSGFATVTGVANAGAAHVWAGGPGLRGVPAPRATLSVPGADANDEFTIGRFADVSGDGILDLIGSSRADVGGLVDLGAFWVFEGGATLAGGVAPVARLATPYLGAGGTLHLAELTGDGITDIVGEVLLADVGGVIDAGALIVWAGGTLVGAALPRAALVATGASPDDRLGSSGVLFQDVTGDGRADVIASSFRTDVAGVADAGAIHVWRGGPGLAGVPPPRATLAVPGAAPLDGLFAAEIPLVDLTGDGIADLVGLSSADGPGAPDAGAAHVWAGGATLLGAPAPLATLRVPGALAQDRLGLASGRHGVRCADLDGNGLAELVLASSSADRGGLQVDTGAIQVFPELTGLGGIVSPRATLLVPTPFAGDGFPQSNGSVMKFADVSGDGVLDVLAGSSSWSTLDSGTVLVWRGGTLSGTPPPQAVLTPPQPMQFDHLGLAHDDGILLADLTRDGVLDLVVAGLYLDGSAPDSGMVLLWRGGLALSGAPAPQAALLNPAAIASEALGVSALRLVDLDRDGQPDVLAGSHLAEPGGIAGTGALFLWNGGPTLTGSTAPDATMSVPGAAPSDHLGG